LRLFRRTADYRHKVKEYELCPIENNEVEKVSEDIVPEEKLGEGFNKESFARM
jgi:hypothetical protein